MQILSKENQCFEQELHVEITEKIETSLYVQAQEKCTQAYDEQQGLTADFCQKIGHRMMLVEQKSEVKQLKLCQSHLRVKTWVTHVTPMFVFRMTVIFYPDTQQPVWLSQTKWACVEVQTGYPKRLSPTFLNAFSQS